MKNIFISQYLISETFDTKAQSKYREQLLSKRLEKDRMVRKESIITPEIAKMLKEIRNELGLFSNNEPSPAWQRFNVTLMNQTRINPKFIKRVFSNRETAKKFIIGFVQKFRREIDSMSGYLSEKKITKS